MKSITHWVQSAILKPVPPLDLSPIPDKPRGKLRLSPEQLLVVIHAHALAEWALWQTQLIQKPRLPKGPGGRPTTYSDSVILLMAIVQTTWHKSYEQMVDWVATNEGLALALGFTQRTPAGKLRTISKGQYWERRAVLGVLPFLFFFLTLVAQLTHLGAITGKELIVDSNLLKAWSRLIPLQTGTNMLEKHMHSTIRFIGTVLMVKHASVCLV